MIEKLKHPLVGTISLENIKKWRALKPWRRHSLVLLVAGAAYIVIGLSYVYVESNPARDVALQYALNWFSLQTWGWWFVITGVVTIISSRWPPVSRTWGYTLLTGISSAWGLFYLAGIAFEDSPISNVTGVIVWNVFAFLWWAISGLVDPADPDGQV